MSGEKGYCNYCDTITNSIVKVYEYGQLIWSGCIDCYEKKRELEKQCRKDHQ